jgi:adenosylcobinamide kinase/adenosylcobinamide-phosphate guanylyltransferase
MTDIVLVTGGARAGKSAWAQRRAEAMSERRTFIATCTPQDDEMRARVARHRATRSGRGWSTLEEPLLLCDALRRAASEYPVAVVDCLTLWLSNRMYQADQAGVVLTEDTAAEEGRRVLEACAAFSVGVVIVTGEVGMGIVPDSAVARLYRDLLGRCNQVIAAGATEVELLVCGQALRIK